MRKDKRGIHWILTVIFFLALNSSLFSQTSIFTTQVPISSGNDGDYELGLKFNSATTAEISGISFYKIAGEDFAHTATLWSSTGQILATASFSAETAEGWQTAALSNPVVISPSTTYIVSVNVNSIYAITPNQLDNAITNDFLTAEASGGVFNENPGQFPTQSFNNSNYFVDVIASPLNSIFTTQIPSGEFNDGPYEMGVKFVTSQTAKVKKFAYYKMNGETGAHVGNLWSSTGTLLASAAFTNETASGWQYADLNSAVYIQPGNSYVVSVNSNTAYGVGDPQSLGSSITNGILSTVADNNNGVFSGSENTAGVFPTISFNNNNYFRDIVVEPLTPPAVPAQTFPVNVDSISIEPDLNWTSIIGATYSLQVATDASFNNLIVDVSGLTQNTYHLTGLSNSTKYFWRVSAEKEILSSGFSSGAEFTTIKFSKVVLSWPINEANLYTSTVQFSWYLPNGGTGWKFDLIYSTDENFSSSNISAGLSSNIYSVSGLEPGTEYFWKIRLKNVNDAVVSYSTVESFTTFGQALVPVLSAPVGNVTVYSLSPTLYWYLNDGSTGLTYDIEVVQGAPGTLTGTPTITGIANTYFKLSTLQPDKQYSWRVRSKSGSKFSDWSTAASFTTFAVNNPVVPIPSWPVGDATIYTSSPVLNWYLGTGATGLNYQIELIEGSSTNFTGTPNITNLTAFSTALSNLTPGEDYKWRIRSSDGITFSNWSDAATFNIAPTIENNPTAPYPSWPVGGATVYSTSTQLSWYLGHTGYGLTYEVEIRNGALTGTPTIIGVNSLNTEVTNLTPSTIYSWRVRSTNGTTTSAWSQTETFKTIDAPVAATVPILSWPIGGATVYSDSPTLSWFLNSSTSGVSYELQYSTNSGMSGAVTVSNITSAYTVVNGLIPGTMYYWRVRSFDGTVYSAFSDIESFVVTSGNSFVVPVAASPAEGTTITASSALLSWYLPTQGDIANYEVQYSDNADMNDAVNMKENTTTHLIDGLELGKTYYWRVRSLNSKGETSAFSNIETFIPAGTTDAVMLKNIPTEYYLKQNYPNPFNPTTVLEFSIKESGYYSLDVFNILGAKVKTLVQQNLNAGVYNVTFEGKNLPSGIYIYRLSGSNINLVKKMLLLK